MDTVVYENIFNVISDNEIEIPEDFPDWHIEPLKQLLNSYNYSYGGLNIDAFLEPDTSINLETLELAIILLIEYEQFSDKSEEPIYIFLRNMNSYIESRGIKDSMDRIIEESSFILGFCSSIAENSKYSRDVIIQFERKL